jgi:prevent-host-death family protein
MAVQMNIAEAKAKLSELVARAEAGEEVIIARDGKPAVVLKPALGDAAALRPRRLGFLAHLGPVWEAPDAWEPDEEAARYAEQSFEEDEREDEPPRDPR